MSHPKESVPSRSFRLALFIQRLASLPRAHSLAEARGQVEDTLNAVEDELSGVPFDPANWQMDGRMYPPEDDFAFPVEGHDEVTLFRARKHRTFIRTNGAILIRSLTNEVILDKPGADGRLVF